MGIIDTGKELAKLAQQLGSVEIQQKVIDLQSDILTLQEDLQRLRKENEDLKDLKKIDNELELRDNAFWRPSAPETRQGPFCTRCWSKDKVLMALLVSETGHQRCSECNGEFPTEGSQQVFKEQIARMNAESQAKRDKLGIRHNKRSTDQYY